jgi:hypothetical protein
MDAAMARLSRDLRDDDWLVVLRLKQASDALRISILAGSLALHAQHFFLAPLSPQARTST